MLEVEVKSLMTPLDTSTSPPSKFVVASLAVKVSVREESVVDEPLVTVVPELFSAVIVMVGAVLSLPTLMDTVAVSTPPLPSLTL